MRNEKPMSYLGRSLHQDFGVGKVTVQGVAAESVSCLNASERHELMAFLGAVLESSTPSELKGMLNRASRAIRMNSAGAKAFLEAVFAELLNIANDR